MCMLFFKFVDIGTPRRSLNVYEVVNMMDTRMLDVTRVQEMKREGWQSKGTGRRV